MKLCRKYFQCKSGHLEHTENCQRKRAFFDNILIICGTMEKLAKQFVLMIKSEMKENKLYLQSEGSKADAPPQKIEDVHDEPPYGDTMDKHHTVVLGYDSTTPGYKREIQPTDHQYDLHSMEPNDKQDTEGFVQIQGTEGSLKIQNYHNYPLTLNIEGSTRNSHNYPLTQDTEGSLQTEDTMGSPETQDTYDDLQAVENNIEVRKWIVSSSVVVPYAGHGIDQSTGNVNNPLVPQIPALQYGSCYRNISDGRVLDNQIESNTVLPTPVANLDVPNVHWDQTPVVIAPSESDSSESYVDGQEISENSSRHSETTATRIDIQTTNTAQGYFGNNAFKCDICGVEIPDENNFYIHCLSHSAGDIFRCPFCHEGFSTESILFLHMRIHSRDEILYNCKVCTKGFPSLDLLSTHALAHKNSFKCNTCSKEFKKAQGLSLHCLIHQEKPHAEKLWKCKFCDKEFISKQQRNGHLRIHGKPSKSKVCEEMSLGPQSTSPSNTPPSE